MVAFQKDFLEQILQNFENDKSIRITNFHTEKACEKGENFMSVLVKIIIKAKRKEGDFTKSLIIKQPHKSQKMREIIGSDNIFRNEIIAYNQILPMLQEYYKMPLPIAKCLFADNNSIVLEDLNVCNYQMNKTDKTLNNEQCLVVLQELAVFHGASIVLKQRDIKRFEQLSKQVKHGYQSNTNVIANFVYRSFGVTLQLLRSVKQCDAIKKAINIMDQLRCNIYQQVCDLITIKAAEDTAIFNHGDFWRNNILFKKLPDDKFEVKFVDLQGMVSTSPAFDISYFLYLHMAPETRHQNTDWFINEYITKLHRIITNHGLQDLKNVYSKQWLMKEMADFAIFGFMCSIWITPVFYLDKNTLPDMDTVKWEAFDSNDDPNLLQHVTPELKTRLLSLVLDFTRTYNF